jgi:hypothetical protein
MNLVQSSFTKLFNDKFYMFVFYLFGTIVFGTLARSLVLHGMTPYHAAWLVCVLVVPFNVALYSSYYWILALIVPHGPIQEERLLADLESLLRRIRSGSRENQNEEAELTKQMLILRTSLLKEKQDRRIRVLEMLFLLCLGIGAGGVALLKARSPAFLFTISVMFSSLFLIAELLWTNFYNAEVHKVLGQFKDLLIEKMGRLSKPW